MRLIAWVLALTGVVESAYAQAPAYPSRPIAFVAPGGTPRDIVERLRTEVARIVDSADIRRRAEELGAFARTLDLEALEAYVVREIEQWANVIRTAGITME